MTTDPFADFADLMTETNPNACPLDLQMATFFGRAGSGKTSVAAQFPNHMYLDLEASATEHTINKITGIKSWARFEEWVTAIHSQPTSPFDGKTLIIDTVTELWEWKVRDYFARQKPPLKSMPDDFGRTLVTIRNEFKRTMQMLLNLRMAQRMGVIFIAHENAKEIVTPTQRLTVYEPRVGDKDIAAWIAEKPQMVLRFSVEDTDPLTGKAFEGGGPKWIIRTKPLQAADVVKDRTERLPPFVLARYDKLLAAYGA